jgi:hypothetical protein
MSSQERWTFSTGQAVCIGPDAFKKGLERCFSTSPTSRSRIVNGACSNYNFRRAKAIVVLAMGNTWSLLTVDGDGVAYYFETGTSIGN